MDQLDGYTEELFGLTSHLAIVWAEFANGVTRPLRDTFPEALKKGLEKIWTVREFKVIPLEIRTDFYEGPTTFITLDGLVTKGDIFDQLQSILISPVFETEWRKNIEEFGYVIFLDDDNEKEGPPVLRAIATTREGDPHIVKLLPCSWLTAKPYKALKNELKRMKVEWTAID